MTTITSFPTSIDPVRDKPTDCSPWCRAHTASYARDFGTFKSREEAEAALADWRGHPRYIAHVALWALTHQVVEGYQQNWVERPEANGGYDLTLESGDAPGQRSSLTPVRLTLHENGAHMTGAEARQLAAYLIRAADLVDRDPYDTDGVVTRPAEL